MNAPLIALLPRQPETWLLLGIAKKKAGDLEGAETACRTAIEKGVASALAWQCLALIKQEQAEYTAAIECFVKCAECGGTDAAIHANLGRLYYQTGRIPEAFFAYAEAARLDTGNAHYGRMLRRVQFVNDVLRDVPVDDAANVYRSSPATDGDDPQEEMHDVFKKTFGLLSGFGHVAAAAQVGQRLLELWPSATTEYLLKAVAGDSRLDRTPPDVIVEHFDSFAEGFETQLIERLRYDVPRKISAVLRDAMDPELLYDILDAGCGTGLCGPLLRPVARELTGVDLSPKMLDQAERRGMYDSLICEELTEFLERSPGRFDVMAAADVLIYFGDLRPVFAATAIAFRPGGLLAMSTELSFGRWLSHPTIGAFRSCPGLCPTVRRRRVCGMRLPRHNDAARGERAGAGQHFPVSPDGMKHSLGAAAV